MKPALATALAVALLAGSAAFAAETTTFKYDALGRLTQSFTAGGTADGTLTKVAHDATDNRSGYSVLNTVKLLHANDRIYSVDNRFYLTLQTNGDLQVVTAATSAVLWSSGTSGQTVDRATFQSDGNFILYSPTSTSLWSTATGSNPAAQITMQNDGNLVIKNDAGTQLWHTNTGGN